MTLALVCAAGVLGVRACDSSEQLTLDGDAIAKACEDAQLQLYPTDQPESDQLHAPIEVGSYGTVVFRPENTVTANKARSILFGKGAVAETAFNEANPGVTLNTDVNKEHPVRGQISAIDSFIVSKDGDKDEDPETKSSIEKFAEDAGIDAASIECLSGFNASYQPDDKDKPYRVLVPRQAIGGELAGYDRVVLQRSDDIPGFVAKVQTAKNISANGVSPADFRPGTILYTKKVASTPNSQTPSPQERYEAPVADVQQFVDEYKQLAESVQKKYKVPKELVLAQAILESGYGSSELARKANNFHGLKANDQWDGEVYYKETFEDISPDHIASYPGAVVMQNFNDRLVRIKYRAAFKKFPTPEAGFLGYGDYLQNRGDESGPYYADAFKERAAEGFVKRLQDNKGKKYATDARYLPKINKVISNVRQALVPDYQALHMPHEFSEYPTDQQLMDLNPADPNAPLGAPSDDQKVAQDLESPQERYDASMRALEAVNASKDGYENFKETLQKNDISRELEARLPRNYSDHDKPELGEPKYFILHFTANPTVANSYDGHKFASSQVNSGGLGINYYINRDGTPYTMSTHYVDHIFTYSEESFGVEIAASEQATVTPAEYETALYLAAHFLIEGKYVQRGQPITDTVKRVVRGHGDIRSTVDNHTDFGEPISDAFRARLINFMTAELDYQQ